LADKEVLLTALNIKSMSFADHRSRGEDKDDIEEEEDDDDNVDDDDDDDDIRVRSMNVPGRRKNSILTDLMGERPRARGEVPIIIDLAFASNVRFLDDHELHLENVELYQV
jgi:hypothetical protein